MSEPCVIEVWGEPAGVLVQEQQRFRFFAVSSLYSALNGSSFSTRGHARLAAIRLQKEASNRLTP